jgi:hypothetical protein
MKILQNIVLSAVIATSMVSFSGSVMANEAKEVASAQDLISTTISHIEAAIAAVNAGEKTEVVLAHIKEARQTQKDVIIGALDQDRQKASAKLVSAGRDLKAGKTQEGKAFLEEALAAYKELLVQANK